MTHTDAARVLVLGATGRTGGAVVRELEALEGRVAPVRASRSAEKVRRWTEEGKDAVRVDLDDPDTFPAALDGVDRLFVVTGYTSAMTHQTKSLVDAAEDAGVGFVVHLGVYTDGRSTDPHFAWHELVERYIAGSRLAWANIRPHVFMENLFGINRLVDGRMVVPIGDKRVGWIANDDIAAVAAKVLSEGPGPHAGKDYYLSTDLLSGTEVAETLTTALGREVPALVVTPGDLRAMAEADPGAAPEGMDAAYFASTLIAVRQIHEGRLDYAATTTTTVRDLLGREPLHFADWARAHRGELLAQLP
ncbi:NmrA family NAD(P)-binding protein [Streptomyces sp. NPDC026672]|uniref:NmrA family NAD(P)-binding protein n=1 Tax=unclassified Streptomyces TaxID=2593676 RepID=UPI0033F6F5B7